jgi:anaerobic selenocysteine-containing dehydrogenase
MSIMTSFRAGSHVESGSLFMHIDHANPPTTEQILEEMTRTSRVPLDVVKQNAHGRLYDEVDERVLPREAGNTDRLQLGAAYVVDWLGRIRGEDYAAQRDREFPFLLVSRRANNFLNSIGRTSATLRKGRGFNPLFVHPDDLRMLGLADGDSVTIASSHDAIPGVVEADATLRRGVVAMAQAFGGQPDEDHRYREIGSNTNRLIAADRDYDEVTGIPRMGALPVALTLLKAERRLANA